MGGASERVNVRLLLRVALPITHNIMLTLLLQELLADVESSKASAACERARADGLTLELRVRPCARVVREMNVLQFIFRAIYCIIVSLVFCFTPPRRLSRTRTCRCRPSKRAALQPIAARQVPAAKYLHTPS